MRTSLPDPCTCHNTGICTACALDRDATIDWETCQRDGLFSMAADLIRNHATVLQRVPATNVIRLDDRRVKR